MYAQTSQILQSTGEYTWLVKPLLIHIGGTCYLFNQTTKWISSFVIFCFCNQEVTNIFKISKGYSQTTHLLCSPCEGPVCSFIKSLFVSVPLEEKSENQRTSAFWYQNLPVSVRWIQYGSSTYPKVPFPHSIMPLLNICFQTKANWPERTIWIKPNPSILNTRQSWFTRLHSHKMWEVVRGLSLNVLLICEL